MSATGSESHVETSEVRFVRAVHRHGLRTARGWMDASFKGLSQTAIAGEIKLSRPTVSGISQSLGSVLLDPATGVRLNPERSVIALGIDFGQARHRIAIADVHGQLFEPADPSKYEIDAPDGPATLSLDWALEAIPALLHDADRSLDDIGVVGVSVPGPVDSQTGKLHVTPPGMDRSWEILDMDSQLLSKLSLPGATVEGDCNASALTEHLWGALRETTDALYVKISRRCACSLLINHRLYRGADGVAGHLGKTFVEDGNGTGEWAWVEDVFSLPALRPHADHRMTAESLVEMAKSNKSLDASLRRGAKALGVALAPIIDAVNPESVVIGGSLGAASLTWVAADLIDGIGFLRGGSGRSVARSALATRIRAADFTRGTAVRGAIASALLKDAPVRIVRQI